MNAVVAACTIGFDFAAGTAITADGAGTAHCAGTAVTSESPLMRCRLYPRLRCRLHLRGTAISQCAKGVHIGC